MDGYTSFTHLNESSDELEKIAKKIYEIRNNGRRDFYFYGTGNDGNSVPEIIEDLEEDNVLAEWHNWKDDMKLLSKALPDIVLHLKGIGKERNDMWQAHFLDGKVQICVVPEFDPDKLQ